MTRRRGPMTEPKRWTVPGMEPQYMGDDEHGEPRYYNPAPPIEVVAAADFDRLRDERDRLREQNHEAASKRDREQAAMASELAAFRNARDRAREVTRDFTVDWTTDPPSQGPYGWWRYSSVDMKDTLTTLVAQRDEARRVAGVLADAARHLLDPDGSYSEKIAARHGLRSALAVFGTLTEEKT